MSISIISTPGRTGTSGSESKWSAGSNSVDFVFQRKDMGVAKFEDNGFGSTRVRYATAIGGVFAGSIVYIFDVFGKYTGLHEVVYVTNSYIEIAQAFDGSSIGYINFHSIYPDYYLEITVFNYDTGSTLAVFEVPSDETGLIRANIEGVLQSELAFDDQYKYDMVNKIAKNQDFSYGIKYREVLLFDGTNYTTGPFIQEGGQWWVTLSAKQLKDLFGQNMREYMSYPYSTGNEMKFMKVAEEPTYFPDYPFSLEFIYSNHSIAKKLNRHVEQLDVNRTLISGTDSDVRLDSSQKEHVNHLSLRKMDALDADCKYLRLYLDETDEDINGGYTGGGGASGGGTGSGLGGASGSYVEDGYVG